MDEVLVVEETLEKVKKETVKKEEAKKQDEFVTVIKFRRYGGIHYVKNIDTKEVKEISENNILFDKEKTVFTILLKDYNKLKTIKRGN